MMVFPYPLVMDILVGSDLGALAFYMVQNGYTIRIPDEGFIVWARGWNLQWKPS